MRRGGFHIFGRNALDGALVRPLGSLSKHDLDSLTRHDELNVILVDGEARFERLRVADLAELGAFGEIGADVLRFERRAVPGRQVDGLVALFLDQRRRQHCAGPRGDEPQQVAIVFRVG